MLTRLGRWRRLLFLGAALGAAAWWLPRLPRDREVRYRLHDPSVRALEVTWFRQEGDAPPQPIRSARWQFPPGQVPSSVQATLSLPAGDYDVKLELRGEGESRELQRHVRLDESPGVTLETR